MLISSEGPYYDHSAFNLLDKTVPRKSRPKPFIDRHFIANLTCVYTASQL